MKKLYLTGMVIVCLLLCAGHSTIAKKLTGRNRPAKTDLKSVLICDVPHVRQKPDFCGEACAEMVLKKMGRTTITQDDIFNISNTDPVLGRGSHTAELVSALRSLGFDVGRAWYRIPAASPEAIREQWDAAHADLVAGIPSIVCMRTKEGPGASEHFKLLLGYDAETQEIIYHEPAELRAPYQRLKLEAFLSCWPLKYQRKTWTIIRLPMDPGQKIRPPAEQSGYDDAAFAQHVMQLKKKIPTEKFTIVIQPPFVVIGDESPLHVNARAEKTVKWATARLKHMYFKKDPEDIIDIWLFKDNKSYRKHCREIFNDNPDTPYGYSSPRHKALIMNIATGGGTLVHEIVHPFVRANFPACPAWFNEGLGSLYEQSQGRGPREIQGLTNWRLAGLQKAIRGKRVPSFRALLSTTDYAFYNEDPGTNYAQARYLCYYLQQKKLLTTFYHQFHKHQKDDPTGYATLKRVLKEDDMPAFEKRWQSYVMKLRFP